MVRTDTLSARGWDKEPAMRARRTAINVSASLELVKEGHLEIRQGRDFAPIPVCGKKD